MSRPERLRRCAVCLLSGLGDSSVDRELDRRYARRRAGTGQRPSSPVLRAARDMATKLSSRSTACTSRPARVAVARLADRWPLKDGTASGGTSRQPAVQRVAGAARGDEPLPRDRHRASAPPAAERGRCAGLRAPVPERLGCGQADRAHALSGDRARHARLDRLACRRLEQDVPDGAQGGRRRPGRRRVRRARRRARARLRARPARTGARAMRPRACSRCSSTRARSA